MANTFDITGKRALITGASRGLGLGCAQALADAGADVVLVGRTAADLETAVKGIGPRASALVCDVTDPAGFRAALATLPAIHVLVNNAGTNIPEPFDKVTEEHYDTIFDINVRAAFFVAQAVVAKMRAGKVKGSIINMSSQMGHVGSPNRTVYCASKHALEGLTKAMGVELAPEGIRVNTVAPTFIETPMTKPFFENAAFKDAVLKNIPLGRIGDLSDVSGAVVFLASDAAGLITGSCIKVDGGWTAQ